MTLQQVIYWLEPTSMIVGLVASVPVFWTWWQVVFGERRARRRWLRQITRQPGERPGVLVVDCLPGKSIANSVRSSLAQNGKLDEIPEDRFHVVRHDNPLRPEDLADLAEDLRKAVCQLVAAGVDVIHLYHAGPCFSAMLTGAELCNGPRVLIYHFEQGQYVCYGPLEPLRFYSQ